MTYTAIAAVCFEIRTKHSTQNEHRVQFLSVKPGGTQRNYLGFKMLTKNNGCLNI